MGLALLCSGQGRQEAAMFDAFLEAPMTREILDVTAGLLGGNIQSVLAGGAGRSIHENRAGQILCVARSLAAAACLEPLPPLMVAGYSVGEVAAWSIAGVWTAASTLALTAERAEQMDRAGGSGGGLGFIRGLDREDVGRLVEKFSCAIAIINPDRLFVIGGDRADVEACCARALEEGALGARPIAVAVASHTSRMAPAVEPFKAYLNHVEWRRPRSDRLLMGAANAAIMRDVTVGIPGLAGQLSQTINWAATLEALYERGADRFLELGPGSALADMARAAYPKLDIRAVDEFRTLQGVRSWIAGG